VIYRCSLFHFENGLELNDSYGVFILGIFYDSTGELRDSTAAVKYCTPYDPFKWIKTIPENEGHGHRRLFGRVLWSETQACGVYA
jgi:hypothetical protein